MPVSDQVVAGDLCRRFERTQTRDDEPIHEVFGDLPADVRRQPVQPHRPVTALARACTAPSPLVRHACTALGGVGFPPVAAARSRNRCPSASNWSAAPAMPEPTSRSPPPRSPLPRSPLPSVMLRAAGAEVALAQVALAQVALAQVALAEVALAEVALAQVALAQVALAGVQRQRPDDRDGTLGLVVLVDEHAADAAPAADLVQPELAPVVGAGPRVGQRHRRS